MKERLYGLTILLSCIIASVFISCTDDDKSSKKDENKSTLTKEEAQRKLATYAFRSDVEAINDLIKQGANVDAANGFTKDNETKNFNLLQLAAFAHQVETIKDLLNAKANKEITDEQDNTLLHLAAYGNKDEIKQFFDENIKKLDAIEDKREKKELLEVFKTAKDVIDDKTTIDILLSAGANVSTENKAGETPLDIARSRDVNGSHKEIILALEAARSKINGTLAVEEPNKKLLSASISGDTAVVNNLINAGADVNTKDEEGNTPLVNAILYGRTEVVKVLISSDEIDVNIENKAGETPLDVARSRDVNGSHKEIILALEAARSKSNRTFTIEELNKHLLSAAVSGDTKAINRLINAGADVNTKDEEGNTPLANAILYGRTEVVKVLISSDEIDVNIENKAGETPLDVARSRDVSGSHQQIIDALKVAGAKSNRTFTTEELNQQLLSAAVSGDTAVVNNLINAGADVNIKSNYGKTALHSATFYGQTEVVKVLVNADKIDVNSKDNDEYTPLHYAALYGQTEIAQALIAKKAHVNVKNNVGATPLHYAASEGNKNIADLLINKGADVNIKNNVGATPLHSAVYSGQIDIAKALIAEKADVNIKNKSGYTPLHSAICNEQKEIAKVLIATKKADVNAKSHNGDTLLDTAKSRDINGSYKEIIVALEAAGAKSNRTLAIEQLNKQLISAIISGDTTAVNDLINAGADVNAKDEEGNTPLVNAILYGKTEVAKVLIEKKADVTIKDHNGESLLDMARSRDANGSHQEIIMALEAAGAKSNKTFTIEELNKQLIFAAVSGDTPAVNHLINAGADVNIKSNYQKNLLHLAAENGRTKVVQVLINANKIDVNTKDGFGSAPLHLAALYGYTEVVKVLTNVDKIDVNSKDNDQYTPLHHAAEKGHTEIVQFLISSDKIDINIKNQNGETPLHLAANNGRTDIAKTLIAEKADVNVKSNGGSTPLHLAVYSGQVEIAKALIAEKADVNIKNRSGYTPFHSAVHTGQTEIAKALISEKTDVNVKNRSGCTPLHSAVYAGQTEITKALIAKKADVNAKSNSGDTPLDTAKSRNTNGSHQEIIMALEAAGAKSNKTLAVGKLNKQLLSAAVSGDRTAVNDLINAGADVNAQDENGYAPLHIAVLYRQTETLKDLITKGADATITDKAGETPLDIAISRNINGSHQEIIMALRAVRAKRDKTSTIEELNKQLLSAVVSGDTKATNHLINAGADVNIKYEDGYSLLHHSAEKGHTQVVTALINADKVNINIKDCNGDTPLHSAILYGQTEIAKALIAKKADVTIKSEAGDTPLHYAALSGQIEIAKVLIAKKADVTITNEAGETPLHLAANNGRTEIAKALIAKGSNVNDKDKYGRTPLHLAVLYKQTEIVKVFIAEGADVTITNEDGETPLDIARSKDINGSQQEIIDALAASGTK